MEPRRAPARRGHAGSVARARTEHRGDQAQVPERDATARSPSPSPDPRSPHLRPHRLRARAPIPVARTTGRTTEAADTLLRKRVQGPLLLVGSRLGRGDRRPALPPYPGPADPRPAARPGPCRCRPHAASLHTRPDSLRARPCVRRPAPGQESAKDGQSAGTSTSVCRRDFRRSTAFVWSCETRDSVTPSTSPISRRVRFS